MTEINSLSYWEKQEVLSIYDAIVIGAGFVGLSAAIYLKKSNPSWNIAVLERGVISYGASTRNAGFACFGTIGELEDDRLNSTISNIVATVKSRWEGLQNLCALIPPNDMNYKNLGGTELFDNKESFDEAAIQIEYWNSQLREIIGESVFQEIDQPHKGFYHKAIFNKYEGQLNPKLAIDKLYEKCAALGIKVFTGINVKSWREDTSYINLETDAKLHFRTRKLALATNGFTKELLPDISMRPARNQVLITKACKTKWKGCYHFNKGYIYFREVDNRILLGGARYLSKDENTSDYGNTAAIQAYLTSFLQERIFSDSEVDIDHWWSGILGIGDKKSPIIAKYSDQIYLAVRLGGMGVAIGTSVGKDLAELIVND